MDVVGANFSGVTQRVLHEARRSQRHVDAEVRVAEDVRGGSEAQDLRAEQQRALDIAQSVGEGGGVRAVQLGPGEKVAERDHVVATRRYRRALFGAKGLPQQLLVAPREEPRHAGRGRAARHRGRPFAATVHVPQRMVARHVRHWPAR